MIVIRFTDKIGDFVTVPFLNLDNFLCWYFKDNNSKWFIDEVLEGQDIITGEIKQKGINNK